MQEMKLITEEERTRAGLYALLSDVEKTRTKARKRKGGWLTESGFDGLLILAFALGFALYMGAQIIGGLPAVLTRHGLI